MLFRSAGGNESGNGPDAGNGNENGNEGNTDNENNSGVPAYVAGGTYTGGQQVSYNGVVYEAKWWTQSTPGSDDSWKVA